MAASQHVPPWDIAVSTPETGKDMPAAPQQALQDSLHASFDARSMGRAAADAADHPQQDQQLLADPSPSHPSAGLPSAPQLTDAVDPKDEPTYRPEIYQLQHSQQQGQQLERQQATGPESAGAPTDSRSTHCTLTATGHVAATVTAAGSENQEEELYGEHDSSPQQQQLQESRAAAARAQQPPTPTEPHPAEAAELEAAAAEVQPSVELATVSFITEKQQQGEQPAGSGSADDVHDADTQLQSQQQQGGKLTAGTASLLAALLRNQQALAALKNQYRKTQYVSTGSPTTQPGTASEQQQQQQDPQQASPQQQQQRMQQLQPHSGPRNSSSGCSSAALGPELQRGLRGLDRHSTAGANPEKQQQQQQASIAAAVTAAADATGPSNTPGRPSSSRGEPKASTETPAAALAAAAASLLRPTGADAAAAVSAAAAAAALSAAAGSEQPMQPETLKQITTYLESMFIPRSKRQQQQQTPAAATPTKHSTPGGGAGLNTPGAAPPSDSTQPAGNIRQRSASPLPTLTPAAAAAGGSRPESPAAAAGTPISRSASPAGASRTSPVPRGVVQQLSAQHKRQLMLRMKAHMQKLGVDIKDHPMMAQLEKLEKEMGASTPAAAAAAAALTPAAGPSTSSRAAGEATQGTTGSAGPGMKPDTAAAGAAAAMGGIQAAASSSLAASAAGAPHVSAGCPNTSSRVDAAASQPGVVVPGSTAAPTADAEQKQRQRQQSRKRALAALFQAEAIKVLKAAAAAAAPAPTLSGLLAPSASGPSGPGPAMLPQHSARSATAQSFKLQTATLTRMAPGTVQGSAQQVHTMVRTSEPTAADPAAAAAGSGQVTPLSGSMSPYTQQQLQSWAEQQLQQQGADGGVQQPPVKRRRSSTPADVGIPQHSMPQHVAGQQQQGHMAGSTAVPQPPDSSTPAGGQTGPPAATAAGGDGSGGGGGGGGGGGPSGKPQIFAASSIAEAAKHFRWISKVNHPRWSKPETPLQRTFDRHVILEGMQQQAKQQQARGRVAQSSSSSQNRVGLDPAAAAATPVGVLPTWAPHASAAAVDSSGGAGHSGARGLAADPALAYTAAVATAVQAIQCRIPQQQPGVGLQQQQQQRVPRHRSASPQQQQEVQAADPITDPLWLLAAAADALPPHEECHEGSAHSTPQKLPGSPSGGSAAAGRLPAGRHDLMQQQQAAGSPCTSTTSGQQQRMQSGTQQGSCRAEPCGGLRQGLNPGQPSREPGPLNPVAPAQAAVTLKGLEAELTRMVQAMGGTVPQFKPAAAIQAVLPVSGTEPSAAPGSQVLAGLMSSMQQQGRQGSGLGVGLSRNQPELSVRPTGPEPIVGLLPQVNAASAGAAGGSGVDYSAALAAAAAAVFAELHSKRQRKA